MTDTKKKASSEHKTQDDKDARHYIEEIAAGSTRREKVSWNRKMDNMITLIAKLKPIDEAILELQAKKQPILDEVDALREVMVRECIHPVDQLVHVPAKPINDFPVAFAVPLTKPYTICKFCNRKLALTKSGLDD